MDDITSGIKNALNELPEKAKEEKWNRETQWTLGVNQAIVNVGRKFGYLTAARKHVDSDDEVEWLYDVVWYQLDNEKNLTRVPLAAECEWGGEEDIKYNFEKIINSKI